MAKKKKAAKKKATSKKAKPTDDAPTPELCGRTRDECARHYGVSTRTVAGWLKDPTFPGRSGTRGQADGWFPYDRIDVWLETKPDKLAGKTDDARTAAASELVAVKAKRESLRYEREAGELINAAEAEKAIQRQIAIAKSILDPLPDRFAALVPAKAGEEVKTKTATLTRTALREAYAALAETLSAIDDDAQT